MPSRVVKILKGEGDEVTPDEGLIVVEAMKMQNEMKFGARSMKFFQAMAPVYNNAYDDATGTKDERHKAAMKAVRAEMDPLINAKYDEKQLTEDFNNVMASESR